VSAPLTRSVPAHQSSAASRDALRRTFTTFRHCLPRTLSRIPSPSPIYAVGFFVGIRRYLRHLPVQIWVRDVEIVFNTLRQIPACQSRSPAPKGLNGVLSSRLESRNLNVSVFDAFFLVYSPSVARFGLIDRRNFRSIDIGAVGSTRKATVRSGDREPIPWHAARATVDGLCPPVDARCLAADYASTFSAV
jgi:hypothetical protein